MTKSAFADQISDLAANLFAVLKAQLTKNMRFAGIEVA